MNKVRGGCSIPGCSNEIYKVTRLADNTTVNNFFCATKENIMPSMHGTAVEGTPLCNEHYGTWYRHINPYIRKCTSCNTNLSNSRLCPQPKGEVSHKDVVCYACYKSHLFAMKQQSQTPTPSTDADLSSTLEQIKQEMPELCSIQTIDQALIYCASLSALDVGKALLKQTALLLPNVYKEFHTKLTEVKNLCGILLSDIDTISNPTWLRSQLCCLLEHHMVYKCSVKKYGTLLYRYGGDLVHALTVALSQTSQCNKSQEQPGFQEKLSEVCQTLNEKCHTHIKKLIEEDAACPHRIESLDIEKLISELDPNIWKAICFLTQPLSTRAINNENTCASATRKLRRFSCVCMLLFTMNSQCSFPLHTVLADVVETCGGSVRLLKILNRLGVCASADTHARYIQYRIQQKKEEGPLHGYGNNAFTVVSADNLDFVHSYARVYCGKQESSWHGTTVQFVQPQPITLASHDMETPSLFTCEEILQPISSDDTNLCPASQSKRFYSTTSPEPQPKKKRRMRTGIEGVGNNPPSTQPICLLTSTPLSEKPNLTIKSFQLSEDERKLLLQVRELCNQYILQKLACNTQNKKLIDLQMYIGLHNNIKKPELSNIIHYKVLDQKCDDKETLLQIITDLHQKFIVSNESKCLLLEGDQATYGRLQSIKSEYGNDLAWLFPFPGDWHFLKNFQEVLIKIYFDGGLCDLAKSSGYNPNSIGSNFKRTHNFLLEAWESMYRHFLSLFLTHEAPTDILDYVANWLPHISMPM